MLRIIVAFGDISGFTAFCDAVTNDQVEYDPFMAEYDQIIDEAARETGYDFDDTGDGFMCTVDIESGNCSQKAIEVVLNLLRLLKKIDRLIQRKKKEPPSPSGFRIVGAAGYAKRTVRRVKKRDGTISVAVVLRGKHINRAHNYLDKARGKGFVCDSSLKDLIDAKQARRHRLAFTPLDEDLWIITVGK